jgi:hypothetical protein
LNFLLCAVGVSWFNPVVDPSADTPVVLDYANPQAGQPLNSRLIFERLEDGVRFTDPPWGWRGVRRNLVFCALGATLCAVWTVGLIAAISHGGVEEAGGHLLALLVTFSITSFGYSKAKAQATKPTVIEARGGILKAQLVHSSAPMSWPAHHLSNLRATIPMPAVGPFGMVCDLVVQEEWGFSVRVLRDCKVAEIKWVVAELRRALKL